VPLERTSVTGFEARGRRGLDGAQRPDTATGSFSIVIGDQPEMDFGGKRNPDGQGFCGLRPRRQGMEVVKAVQSSATGPSGPYGAGEPQSADCGREGLPAWTLKRPYGRASTPLLHAQ